LTIDIPDICKSTKSGTAAARHKSEVKAVKSVNRSFILKSSTRHLAVQQHLTAVTVAEPDADSYAAQLVAHVFDTLQIQTSCFHTLTYAKPCFAWNTVDSIRRYLKDACRPHSVLCTSGQCVCLDSKCELCSCKPSIIPAIAAATARKEHGISAYLFLSHMVMTATAKEEHMCSIRASPQRHQLCSCVAAVTIKVHLQCCWCCNGGHNTNVCAFLQGSRDQAEEQDQLVHVDELHCNCCDKH
jgi:hypothetical protein